MRWQNSERSRNVDDRRRGGGRARKVGGGIGIGTIILAVILLIMGENPLQLLSSGDIGIGGGQVQQEQTGPRADDELAEFVKVVLKETEDVWNKIFREQLGRDYKEPILVLFDGQTGSACGHASASTGPFYCPGDDQVYIDLSFYNDLQKRFGAGGDFAMAYVVAHEVAHHIQNLLGITRQVDAQRGRLPKAQFNDLSVRLELQADFFAGVWAHHGQKMKGFLEKGDIEEALGAANAIGDDRIQMRSRGYVVPESFTHGTSEQRMRWFMKGFETGDISQGDTFQARSL